MTPSLPRLSAVVALAAAIHFPETPALAQEAAGRADPAVAAQGPEALVQTAKVAMLRGQAVEAVKFLQSPVLAQHTAGQLLLSRAALASDDGELAWTAALTALRHSAGGEEAEKCVRALATLAQFPGRQQVRATALTAPGAPPVARAALAINLYDDGAAAEEVTKIVDSLDPNDPLAAEAALTMRVQELQFAKKNREAADLIEKSLTANQKLPPDRWYLLMVNLRILAQQDDRVLPAFATWRAADPKSSAPLMAYFSIVQQPEEGSQGLAQKAMLTFPDDVALLQKIAASPATDGLTRMSAACTAWLKADPAVRSRLSEFLSAAGADPVLRTMVEKFVTSREARETDKPAALLAEAMLAQKAGMATQAAARIAELEKEFPQHPVRIVYLAEQQVKGRRPLEALRLLASAQPRTDAVRAAYVRISVEQRRPVDAAEWLTEPAGPTLTETLKQTLPALTGQERWKEAAAVAGAASMRESLTDQPQVLLQIGRALAKTKRHAEALPVLLSVLPLLDSAVPPTTVHYLEPRGLSLANASVTEAEQLKREQRLPFRGENAIPPAVQCLGAICRAAEDARLDEAARQRLARHLNGLMRDAGLALFLPEHGEHREDVAAVAAQWAKWWSEFEGSEALAVWFLQNKQVTAIPRPALELLWKHLRGDEERTVRTACGLALHPETKDPLTYLEQTMPAGDHDSYVPEGFWPGLERKLAAGWKVPQPLADRLGYYAGLLGNPERASCGVRLASPEMLAKWMMECFDGKRNSSYLTVRSDGGLPTWLEWARRPQTAWARRRVALALPFLGTDEQRDQVKKVFGIVPAPPAAKAKIPPRQTTEETVRPDAKVLLDAALAAPEKEPQKIGIPEGTYQRIALLETLVAWVKAHPGRADVLTKVLPPGFVRKFCPDPGPVVFFPPSPDSMYWYEVRRRIRPLMQRLAAACGPGAAGDAILAELKAPVVRQPPQPIPPPNQRVADTLTSWFQPACTAEQWMTLASAADVFREVPDISPACLQGAVEALRDANGLAVGELHRLLTAAPPSLGRDLCLAALEKDETALTNAWAARLDKLSALQGDTLPAWRTAARRTVRRAEEAPALKEWMDGGGAGLKAEVEECIRQATGPGGKGLDPWKKTMTAILRLSDRTDRPEESLFLNIIATLRGNPQTADQPWGYRDLNDAPPGFDAWFMRVRLALRWAEAGGLSTAYYIPRLDFEEIRRRAGDARADRLTMFFDTWQKAIPEELRPAGMLMMRESPQKVLETSTEETLNTLTRMAAADGPQRAQAEAWQPYVKLVELQTRMYRWDTAGFSMTDEEKGVLERIAKLAADESTPARRVFTAWAETESLAGAHPVLAAFGKSKAPPQPATFGPVWPPSSLAHLAADVVEGMPGGTRVTRVGAEAEAKLITEVPELVRRGWSACTGEDESVPVSVANFQLPVIPVALLTLASGGELEKAKSLINALGPDEQYIESRAMLKAACTARAASQQRLAALLAWWESLLPRIADRLREEHAMSLAIAGQLLDQPKPLTEEMASWSLNTGAWSFYRNLPPEIAQPAVLRMAVAGDEQMAQRMAEEFKLANEMANQKGFLSPDAAGARRAKGCLRTVLDDRPLRAKIAAHAIKYLPKDDPDYACVAFDHVLTLCLDGKREEAAQWVATLPDTPERRALARVPRLPAEQDAVFRELAAGLNDGTLNRAAPDLGTAVVAVVMMTDPGDRESPRRRAWVSLGKRAVNLAVGPRAMDNMEEPSSLAIWLQYKSNRWREYDQPDHFLLPEEAQCEFGGWWPALPEGMQRALCNR